MSKKKYAEDHIQVVHVGFDTRAERDVKNNLISVFMPDADVPLKVTWERTNQTCPAIIRKAFGFPFTPLLDPETPAFYRRRLGVKLTPSEYKVKSC